MKKILIVGCGSYMDAGYGCPGEWRCLKAAALGDGNFEEASQVMGFIKCECPGRATAPNIGMTIKLSEVKPDAIYLSNCMAKAKPDCPYSTVEEKIKIIEEKTGITAKAGTHNYL